MKRLLCIVLLIVATSVQAQIDAQGLKYHLEKHLEGNKLALKYPSQVKEFYTHYNYRLAWINSDRNREYFLSCLDYAPDLGLWAEDYQFTLIQAGKNHTLRLFTFDDSIAAELQFADAVIHFYTDVANGNRGPDISYNGLNYQPACIQIPMLLSTALTRNTFQAFLGEIECKSPEYLALKSKIVMYNRIMEDSLYDGKLRLTSPAANDGNKPLLQKLFQQGIIQSPANKLSTAELKKVIKQAQRLFGLLDDGILHSTIIAELNVPLKVRLESLSRSINTTRWLRCLKLQGTPLIIVNIPSATLLVYKHTGVVLESKVIVGKKSTRTPVFASKIHEVVLYPYWMVPKSIATRELLPIIKRNPAYLSANAFQVVNEYGRVVDASTINWQGLNTSYFPYTLRQSTGCDNSLGLIKLNFHSPYAVYLHDTPGKTLFDFNKRYFSHGCIRVQKAMELAHLALKENTIAIDTLEEKGCLRNQRPIAVPVSEKIPVLVLYHTAWVDSSATVRFYEDVYNKFSAKP